MSSWHSYYIPSTVNESIELLGRLRETAQLVAGGTDLLVEYRRGKASAPALVDLTRIPELQAVRKEAGYLVIGAAVTHARLATSIEVQRAAPLLAQAAWSIGSPQVRNRGTIGGNLGTASPSGDCLPPLAALEAEVEIAGPSGRRWVGMEDFMLGPKQTTLAPGELVCAVRFRPLNGSVGSAFVKYGIRRGRSIAIASAAVILEVEDRQVRRARVALGAVSPRVQRFPEIERALVNCGLNPAAWEETGQIAGQVCSPISDIRASAEYRRHLAGALVKQAVGLAARKQPPRVRDGTPPFVLGQPNPRLETPPPHGPQPVEAVRCCVNGQETTLPADPGMTLLHALRRETELHGAKEGCAEGECGACTVLLDDLAVLGCLTPAAAAHGRSVRTIEGAGDHTAEGPLPHTHCDLSRVQQALIESGAVQCGFCTPGLVMSATALLESQAERLEQAEDPRALIREALSGNLCRCTGYAPIVDAVEAAMTRLKEAQP